MSLSPLSTKDAASKLKVDLIENGIGTQALHETVVAYRANRRAGTHSTLTKATVAGSGKKPWRQKGTGNARAGYRSSPVWSGGGVVFGPHPRDYSKLSVHSDDLVGNVRRAAAAVPRVVPDPVSRPRFASSFLSWSSSCSLARISLRRLTKIAWACF